MKRTVTMMAIVAGLIAAPAMAQTPPAGQTTPKQPPSPKATSGTTTAGPDAAFVKEAAIGGMAEVELGNLAKERGSSSDVKQFGDRMVTDHSKANDELKQWAQQKNITLPTELDAKHKATRDKLAKLSGDAFDKAYMHEMLTDHREDVSAFKRESTSAKDADLKAWAGKTLPTLQEHLKLAQDTATKVGAGGEKKTAAKSPKKH